MTRRRKRPWGNVLGSETTRVCGAKRLGLKIEAKRLGGNDQGGNVLGAKRLVTDETTRIQPTQVWAPLHYQFPPPPRIYDISCYNLDPKDMRT